MIRVTRIIYKYCYENKNIVMSFNIKTINKIYTDKYIEIVISKITTASVREKEIAN